jgi:hypothetical protein
MFLKYEKTDFTGIDFCRLSGFNFTNRFADAGAGLARQNSLSKYE